MVRNIFRRSKTKKKYKAPYHKTFRGQKYTKWSSHSTKADAKRETNKWRGTRRARTIYTIKAQKPYNVYIGPTVK